MLLSSIDRAPGYLLVLTLLLGSLAWSLVSAEGHGEDFGPGTPRNFRHLFIGRCEEYQHVIFPAAIKYVA